MAKSKNNKKKKPAQPPAQQTMSPKNYLLTGRARKLPVGECWVSADSGAGLRSVVVARTHVTGNVTVGVYLVDIFCLGVKNTMYDFNISSFEYKRLLEKVFGRYGGFDAKDYEYVHNLIYGAIEYAAELGLQPHEDWDVAQFVLEPRGAVPHIEFEFGQNGRPFYMRGPYDNYNKIINTLNRTVGPDGYEYMTHVEDGSGFLPFDFDDDDDDYDDDDDVEEVESEEVKS